MEKRKGKIGLAAVILLVYGLLAYLFSPVFYLNDDVAIRSILSGSYTGTPDGHGVYMGYPLTGILALLYGILGNVPWFALLFAGCILYSIYVVAVEGCQKSIVGTIVLCTFGFILQFDNLLYTHYTIVASVLAGTAIFLWVYRKKKTASIILLLLCYMVRSQVFFLSIPFLMVAMLYRLVKEKEVAKQLIACGIVALGVLACMLCTKVMYSSEEWKSFLSFNEVRTQLYDYTGFSSYPQDMLEEELGLTGTQYQMLSSYDTILDSRVDEELLIQAIDRAPDGKTSIKEVLNGYINFLKYERMPLRFFVLLLYVALFATVFLKKDFKLLLPSLAIALGRNTIWLYLMWQGRFPERIIISLYFLEGLLLLGLLLREVAEIKKELLRFACIGGAVCLIALAYLQVRYTTNRMEKQLKYQQEWNNLKEYCLDRPDNLYLLDVFSVVVYGEMQYEKDPENMMLLGGWMTKNPLVNQRFEKYQAKDAAEALLGGQDVYLVLDRVLDKGNRVRDVEWLNQYFKERFGDVSVKKVDEVFGSSEKIFEIYVVETEVPKAE